MRPAHRTGSTERVDLDPVDRDPAVQKNGRERRFASRIAVETMVASEQLPGRLAWRSLHGDWHFLGTSDSLLLLLSSLTPSGPVLGMADTGVAAELPGELPAGALADTLSVLRVGTSPQRSVGARVPADVWRHLIRSDPGLAAWAFEWVEAASLEPSWDEDSLLQRLAQWTTVAHLSATLTSVTCGDRGLPYCGAGDGPSGSVAGPECSNAIGDRPTNLLLAAMASAYTRVEAWECHRNCGGQAWQPSVADGLQRRRQTARELLAAGVLAASGDAWENAEPSNPDCEGADVCQMLLRRMARLESLERDFEEQLRRAKLAALRELAYGASHEINNPLANIASRAQLLLRDESDPQRRRSLATIHGQAMRAHEMIADMMLFAKPPRPDRKPVDLQELLQAWAEHFRQNLPATIVFRCDAGADGEDREPTVRLDPEQAYVAWDAIARNAVEAMEGSGQLTVRVQFMDRREAAGAALGPELDTAGGWVWVVFEDSGPGLSDRAREHLFDPFFSGREAGRGLGFGLSKAWRIAELHGGAIEAHSTRAGVRLRWGVPRG